MRNPRTGGGRRGQPLVLVADDRREYRDTLGRHLTAGGYDVVTAVDGVEAVERASAHRPDLILLDIVMPRMNGIDACRALKADPHSREIDVVMVSSLTDPDEINEAMRAGAVEFMVKPVDRTELLALVGKLLGAPAAHAA